MKRFLLILSILTLSGSVFGQDLQITTLQSPSDGCQLSATENIFVTVWNGSPVPHGGNFDMSYSLNNGPVVTVSNTTTIGPSAIYNFTFPVPDDFSACQAHDLKVWVTGGIDVDHSNDTLWATIISDCPANPGSVWGNETTICEGINNDSVFVTGQNGPVIAWENSTDGVTWNTANTTDTFFEYNNLAGSTIWRVIVDSPFGICGPDTSAWFTLLADSQSDAGTLPADFDICDNGNNGEISTTGYNGSITNWLLSSNFGSSWIPLSQTNDTITYNNLQNSTQYVVIVQNGVCPPDTSSMINLNLIPGTAAGTISGPTVVCNLENSDSLVACCGNGTVIGWNVSTDGGVTWSPTTEQDSVFAFSGLGQETWFQAVWQYWTCPTETADFSVVTLPVILDHIPDTTIEEGDAINLFVNVNGGGTFTWWPDQFMDDINSSTPIVDPDSDITYFCEVVSIEGCKDTIRVVVTVNEDITTLVIPNLFTPNSDGFNDLWEIGNIQTFVDNELIIFNAYGQVVYQAQPYNNDWDGSFNSDPLPDGTYFYQLDLKIPPDDPNYVEPIQGIVTIAGNQ